MTRIIQLSQQAGIPQRLRVVPERGGGVAGWEAHTAGGWQALLRPWEPPTPEPAELVESGGREWPLQRTDTLACFPLLPWSNRIAGGGFEAHGRFLPIARNRIGSPYPFHGNGWMQPWQVVAQTEGSLALALRSEHMHGYPFDYSAEQHFTLGAPGAREGAMEEARLTIRLAITHEGAEPMPYGLGLHPFLLAPVGSLLQIAARGCWQSDDSNLPVRHDESVPRKWDFSVPRMPGHERIDTVFTGWDGQMQLDRPDIGLRLTMECQDTQGLYVLFTPPGKGWICVEPVTHVNNAHNLPGQPGLRWLARGESMSLTMVLRVAAMTSAATA